MNRTKNEQVANLATRIAWNFDGALQRIGIAWPCHETASMVERVLLAHTGPQSVLAGKLCTAIGKVVARTACADQWEHMAMLSKMKEAIEKAAA